MKQNSWILKSKMGYTITMKPLLMALILLVPSILFARIPTPNQVSQQQANVYGTYTGNAGSWGYNNYDPYLAQRGFGASNSYQQYGQLNRTNNLLGIGVSLIDVFTSKGSFGEKVKFLMMDQLKRRVKDPLEQQLNAASQNLTLEQLYMLANRGQNQPHNQAYSQCVGCINQNPNAWRPTHTNQHAVGNQLTQFTSGSGQNSTTSNTGGGLGGVVSPVQ